MEQALEEKPTPPKQPAEQSMMDAMERILKLLKDNETLIDEQVLTPLHNLESRVAALERKEEATA